MTPCTALLTTFVWPDYWRCSCILADFLLALSNVGFLPPSWSWTILHPGKTRPRASVEATCFCQSRHGVFSWRGCPDMLLLRPTSDQLSMFLMLRPGSEAVTTVAPESFLQVRLGCRRFIVHRSSDKPCRLFQSFWSPWPAVTAVGNRELGMTGACRWRYQQGRMVEAFVQAFYCIEVACIRSSVFKFSVSSSSGLLPRLNNTW